MRSPGGIAGTERVVRIAWRIQQVRNGTTLALRDHGAETSIRVRTSGVDLADAAKALAGLGIWVG